jgi:hypothetical protein
MLAALEAAYEDACGKPPRGPRCDDPDWLAEQTRAALVATSIREAAAKSAGEDIAAAALEAEIKRRGLMRKPVTVESRRIPRASGFRGVGWHKATRKWQASISIDKKCKSLGYFEATARGEVDAALAFDVAVRAAGRPEKANFEPGGGEPESGALAQPPAATAEAPPVPVGTEISKEFDGIAYRGQVVSFDPEHKLYAGEYDDGDAEELSEEVRATFEKRKTQHQIYYFNMLLSNFLRLHVTG